MNVRLSPNVTLANSRIPAADAERQRRTAFAILKRFDEQPGVILADEVGMGKTFVALAVAYSVVEAHDFKTQVVVMVPNSVRDKWPREWSVFRDRCLRPGTPVRAAAATVTDAVGFLKKLDDPLARREHVIFATHSALTGQLRDPFVRLAIIARVLRRPTLEAQRRAFPGFAKYLIHGPRFKDSDFVQSLLSTPPLHWREVCEAHSFPEADDPVPQAVVETMAAIRFDELAEALSGLPLRSSSRIEERFRDVRRAISAEIGTLWSQSLQKLDIDFPLLVLDEAHHLKNPDTQLARILSNGPGDSDEDGGATTRGALGGVFRRMLFLTATPFQLGLCGCCTVLVDGRAVSGCLFLAAFAEGTDIVTVEHLAADGKLDPVQAAFIECGAFQCGFCTPGFVLMAGQLIREHPDPGDDDIRHYLSGNLCRCATYPDIIEAVKRAARTLRASGGGRE